MTTARFRTIEVSDLDVEGLRFVTVQSPALGRRADLTLWVPDAPGPLPIAIMLHGVYGSHWAWAFKAGLHRTAQGLMRAGRMPPMVIAMPSDGLWEDGSGYLPLPGLDVERWILDEVVDAAQVAAPQATRKAGVCIGGLSMGGFGALRLAALHPQRFHAVAVHSTCTDARQLDDFTAVPLPDTGDVASLLGAASGLPPLRFDCGLDDHLLSVNRELHRRLTAAGVAHTYEEYPGGHDWAYWAEHAVETLEFFGTALTSRQGFSSLSPVDFSEAAERAGAR